MPSITYFERIKIETFCELGLSNIQMGDRLNRSPSTISYELSRYQPYRAEFAQTDAEYKRSRCGRKTKLSDELKQPLKGNTAIIFKKIAIVLNFFKPPKMHLPSLQPGCEIH